MRCGCAAPGAAHTDSSIRSASSSEKTEKTLGEGVEDRNPSSGGLKKMVQNVILVFFRRRLSQRPAVEELESRNILKREYRSSVLYENRLMLNKSV